MQLTKRVKISIITILLSVGLFSFPLVEEGLKLYFLAGIVFASYVLSVWSIFQDLEGFEFINLFVLPVLLTLSFGLFIHQFNPGTQVRLLLSVVYGVVVYINLLAENIFNVSAERNIPLLRAARTVGYLVTLFVSFAFFSLLYGLGLSWWVLTIISFVIGTLIFTQAVWQVELEETLSRELLLTSFVAGLLLAQLATALAFWPLTPPKVGLAMTAMVYVTLGILQHMIQKDLTSRAAFEYVFVAFSVFLLLIVTTTWGI
jgi:hypothetical protein